MSSTPSGAAGAEELQSITVPKIGEVPFELLNRHEKRTTRLINSSGSPEPVKSQSRLFYFEFNEFICVTWIVIETLEFSDGMEFDYKWQGPDYVEHSGTQRVKGDRVEIRIDGIVKSISFKPPRHFFAKPYINRVKIFGFPLKEAESFIRFAEKLEDLRERENKHFAAQLSNLEEKKIEVAAIQASRGTLQQDIEKLKSQFSREQGRLRKIEAEIAISTTKLAEMERNSSTQSDLFLRAKSELTRMNENRDKMVIEVEGLVRRLNELNSNIDLFPSELSGFSKQAAKDARTFFWLSLIPIMLIATMFYLLVHGAADLTTKITGSENVNILALAVSRAPYVAVASAIIAASYYLAKMLILEIVRISRQRLSLTKISIIAKDVSSSIDSDLDLPRDERYALRLRLKMDLMRDYMKDYLSKEFAPTLPKRISAYQSIFARNVDGNEAPVSE